MTIARTAPRQGPRPAGGAVTPGMLVLGITLAGAGLLLALAARGAGPLPGDLALTRAIQRAIPPDSGIGAILRSLGRIIWGVPLVAVVAALLARWWAAAVALLVAGGTALIVGELLLPPIVARPRPTAALVRVEQPLPADGYGFPSGTVLFAVVTLGLIGYLVWTGRAARPGRAGPLAIVTASLAALLVVLVSLSRVEAGAHWPSDVLGGWLCGGAWLLVLVAAYRGWRGGDGRRGG